MMSDDYNSQPRPRHSRPSWKSSGGPSYQLRTLHFPLSFASYSLPNLPIRQGCNLPARSPSAHHPPTRHLTAHLLTLHTLVLLTFSTLPYSSAITSASFMTSTITTVTSVMTQAIFAGIAPDLDVTSTVTLAAGMTSNVSSDQTGSETVDDSRRVGATGGCPVSSEFVRRCRCTGRVSVRCHDIDTIPEFISTAEVVGYDTLYLDRQAISKLPRGAFGRLHVTTIVLNFNPLVTADALNHGALQGGVLGSVLQELQLGGCGIQSLPYGLLASMDELRTLHLWANHIKKIPAGFFKGARKLTELTLWSNDISELDENTLAGLWNLRRLDLDRNKIKTLSKIVFRHLPELEVLHLGENMIQALSGETFSYMSTLRVLNLDHNGIKFIYPKAFDGLDRLDSLALNDNLINFIPDDMFSNLRNLSTLLLYNNAIEFIWPKTFLGLPTLRRLHLANNRLTVIPDGAFRGAASLRSLSLETNDLQTLRRCALHRDTRLKELALHGNRMRCDCHLSLWAIDMYRSVDKTVMTGACKVSGATRNMTSRDRGDGGGVEWKGGEAEGDEDDDGRSVVRSYYFKPARCALSTVSTHECSPVS